MRKTASIFLLMISFFCFSQYALAAKTYYENGNLEWDIPMKDGKRHGVAKSYYKNGTLKSESPFKNGEREGVMKSYYKNGALEEWFPFKNGKQDGVSKIYNPMTGALVVEVTFKNDKEISRREY